MEFSEKYKHCKKKGMDLRLVLAKCVGLHILHIHSAFFFLRQAHIYQTGFQAKSGLVFLILLPNFPSTKITWVTNHF